MKKFYLLFLPLFLVAQAENPEIGQWDMFELILKGPQEGNPFTDVDVTARFTKEGSMYHMRGFYDGKGCYKIRFMPDETGTWHYTTESNTASLHNKTGKFKCIPPAAGNHGPVRVQHQYHFAYADGTPYRPVGTTCYAWVHQDSILVQQTLTTLASSPFNKIRMCVFPKDYVYNKNEPPYHPFARSREGENDYGRFNPAFWHHFEWCLTELQQLGIEADIILFHPYDRWGYAHMDRDTDDFYLEYVTARLAAYRHVWWSLANEFDFMQSKSMADWDRFFSVIVKNDPYHHLRGIHNGRDWYDHGKPWVTHCSIQSSDFSQMRDWQLKYNKPIIFDECRYEGNVPEGWGNITAEEMVRRFWLATTAGCYCGHGETYQHPRDILWWSKGGVLHGESPQRIAFLKQILDESPKEGIRWLGEGVGGVEGNYYLYYFDRQTPSHWTFEMPPYRRYRVEIIDTWEMTIDQLDGTFGEAFRIDLPGKSNIAVRIQAVGFDFPAEPVTLIPQENMFIDEIRIALNHRTHKKIYYTLDGTIPDENAASYQKPLQINRDGTTLKVISIGPEGQKSKLISRTYHQTTAAAALKISESAPGLQYKLYNGEWDNLPVFDELTPVKSGIVSTFNITPTNRDDLFGLVFEGYIKIPKEEVYTFTTISDDGSRLWINDQEIINNDGQHAPQRRSGQIGLAEGFHKIKVVFFENRGGEELTVFWSSQELAEQEIPQMVLFH